MLTPSPLTPAQLSAALSAGYALDVTTLEFLPVGNDPAAWLYRVAGHSHATPTGKRYLVKLKRGRPTTASLYVPAYLQTHGLAAAVAPLATCNGELAWPVGDFTVILYPLIAGETGMTQGLSRAQWRAFGRLVSQWHRCELPTTLTKQLPRETFLSAHSNTVAQLDALLAETQMRTEMPYTTPHQQTFALLWQNRRTAIRAILNRLRELGTLLQNAMPPFVLCHADCHTANLLVDAAGALHVVDWDGVLLAPKERDLIFVMARAVVHHEPERAFFRGYGPTQVDPIAFAYYRYEWVIQEFADYGSRLFLLPEMGLPTQARAAIQADAVAAFHQLFQPGDVVDVAYATEQEVGAL